MALRDGKIFFADDTDSLGSVMATLPAARFLVTAMSSVRICVQQACAGQAPMGPEY
jgi:hypothetical protein